MNLILSYLIFKYSKSLVPCYYTNPAVDSYSQADFFYFLITCYNALHSILTQYSEASSHHYPLFTFISSSGPAHLPPCLKLQAHYPRCNLQFGSLLFFCFYDLLRRGYDRGLFRLGSKGRMIWSCPVCCFWLCCSFRCDELGFLRGCDCCRCLLGFEGFWWRSRLVWGVQLLVSFGRWIGWCIFEWCIFGVGLFESFLWGRLGCIELEVFHFCDKFRSQHYSLANFQAQLPSTNRLNPQVSFTA